MAKFVLAYTGGGSMEGASAEEQQKVMEEWMNLVRLPWGGRCRRRSPLRTVEHDQPGRKGSRRWSSSTDGLLDHHGRQPPRGNLRCKGMPSSLGRRFSRRLRGAPHRLGACARDTLPSGGFNVSDHIAEPGEHGGSPGLR